MQRLLYAPYEIEGINIYNPSQDSSLVPFIKNLNEEKNIFVKIESTERWIFNSYENRNLFSDLFKDIEFTLWNFGDEFSKEDWSRIFNSNNSIFLRLHFLNNLLNHKDKWIYLNNLYFCPYIILQIFKSTTEIYELDLNEIKYRILKYFIDSIYEGKNVDLAFLLDLFLFLPSSQGKTEYDYQYETKIKLRNYLIQIFSENKDKIDFELALNKIKEQIDKSNNFSSFDILSNYWEFSDELKNIIIGHYYKILELENLIDHYYDIDGKNNLFRAISHLNDYELDVFLNKYDFVYFFENITEDSKDVYNKGIKLRFHLGILTQYLLNNELKNERIIDYILNSYKKIIKIKSDIIEPLDWDDIVSDTFLFNSNFNEKQLLSIIIIDLLAFKDNNYISKYFNEIKNRLSFTELSFYKEKFPKNEEVVKFDLNSSFPKSLDYIGLGRATRETQLLLENFPDKAIRYVDYIENLGKGHSSNDVKKIKFRAYLILKDFDNAESTLHSISGNINNLIGTFYYFTEDFSKSVEYFEKCSNFLTTDDIIIFSAALVKNSKPQDAINLLNQIKEENPEKYFIYYNLGIAYKEIDKYQSLIYLNYAKKIKPELTDIKLEFFKSLNSLIPDFATVLEEFSDEPNLINDIMTEFNSQSTLVLKTTSHLNIDKTEKLLVSEIFSALEERALDPIRLSATKENDLSNDIKGILKGALKKENIIIEREAPRERSVSTVGEIDLFIYIHPDEILAVGENKEWSPDKFERQLKQLLGYIRENRGFGFTIIFNKIVSIETVRIGREKILKEFVSEVNGEKYYNIIGPIYNASIFVNNIKDVFLTVHKNGNSFLRLYHFLINAYDPVRAETAKQARIKNKK